MQPHNRKRIYSVISFSFLAIVALGYQRYYLATHPPVRQTVAAPGDAHAQSDAEMDQTLLAVPAEVRAELARLEEAVSKAPRDISRRWALADAYQKAGLLPLAARQLERITAIAPKSTEGRLALADVRLATREFDAAAQSYREYLRQSPKSVRAWQGFAASLYHQKRFFEALEAAQKANSLSPGDVNSDVMLAASALEYATQYPSPLKTHAKELRLAKQHFERAIKRLPQNGALHLKLGTACTALQESACAVNNLRRAEQLMPGQSQPTIMLGRALMLTGNRKAAQEHVDAALRRHSESAELHFLRASLYRLSKAPESPQISYDATRKAVELSPNKGAYQEAFGMAALRMGKLEEARAAFEHAIQKNPDSRMAYLQLSAIHNKLGQGAIATQYAKKASAATEKQSYLSRLETLYAKRPKDVTPYLALADQYAAEGLLRGARDIYLQALLLQPTSGQAKTQLAALQAKLNTR